MFPTLSVFTDNKLRGEKMHKSFGLLPLSAAYFERPWGGASVSGFKAACPAKVGEVWLTSDHVNCQSLVTGGPHEGRSLHDLMGAGTRALLGSRPEPVGGHRFPLLLKLIHAAELLSVQVHPDDAAAEYMAEPDGGKTEMWYVMDAAPGSRLYCGLAPDVTADGFRKAIEGQSVENLLAPVDVTAGTSVFVPARTVHAIGAGIVLAEIQQNSDVTYRVYDWGRVKSDGTSRKLEVDKAVEVTDFASNQRGANIPLSHDLPGGGSCDVLAACRFFAAERVHVDGDVRRDVRGETFHVLLALSGGLAVMCQGQEIPLPENHAVVVSGGVEEFQLAGSGTCLDYYVPDLSRDVVAPLVEAGYAQEEVTSLVDLAMADRGW